MKSLKNVPELPTALKELISIQPGQIISMALSKNEKANIILFGVAEGEGISEEAYETDTLYYILEGQMPLFIDTKEYILEAGDCIAVPAGTLHAIGGQKAFKMLQITL